MKKLIQLIIILSLIFSLSGISEVNANTTKIMWGKTELKIGQIGKVTILFDTNLVKLESNGSLTKIRTLKKGDEFRVYSYKGNNDGLYGVGGGSFVQKNPAKVKYETPSKSKLALLAQLTKKDMKVHFINVGQGDSVLIQSPNGKNMLVDGGAKSAGNQVVSFLKSKEVSKLDYVVATHPDADHIGGLIAVLNAFPVSNFVDTGQAHTSQTYLEMLSLIDTKNINYITPKTGDKLALDTAIAISVLNAAEQGDDNNEASIVLQVKYNGISFLLMGDADAGQEKEIMAKFNVQATILKAGHHGSNTSSSSEFINAVKPKETILSYSKDNSYGHPHKEVVTNLMKVNSKIYSTAEAGNITVTTNGQTYAISAKQWSGGTVVPTPTPSPKPPITTPKPPTTPDLSSGTYVIPGAPTTFANCSAMREYYPYGVKSSHPAYASKHDRDKDGWACDPPK